MRFLIYTETALRASTPAKLQRIAEAYEISTKGLSPSRLRQTILRSPHNLSDVPHPLIQLPVED